MQAAVAADVGVHTREPGNELADAGSGASAAGDAHAEAASGAAAATAVDGAAEVDDDDVVKARVLLCASLCAPLCAPLCAHSGGETWIPTQWQPFVPVVVSVPGGSDIQA